jgi:hypothetical protein
MTYLPPTTARRSLEADPTDNRLDTVEALVTAHVLKPRTYRTMSTLRPQGVLRHVTGCPLEPPSHHSLPDGGKAGPEE